MPKEVEIPAPVKTNIFFALSKAFFKCSILWKSDNFVLNLETLLIEFCKCDIELFKKSWKGNANKVSSLTRGSNPNNLAEAKIASGCDP